MVRTLDGVCDDIPYCCNVPTAFVLLFDWPGRLFVLQRLAEMCFVFGVPAFPGRFREGP